MLAHLKTYKVSTIKNKDHLPLQDIFLSQTYIQDGERPFDISQEGFICCKERVGQSVSYKVLTKGQRRGEIGTM